MQKNSTHREQGTLWDHYFHINEMGQINETKYSKTLKTNLINHSLEDRKGLTYYKYARHATLQVHPSGRVPYLNRSLPFLTKYLSWLGTRYPSGPFLTRHHSNRGHFWHGTLWLGVPSWSFICWSPCRQGLFPDGSILLKLLTGSHAVRVPSSWDFIIFRRFLSMKGLCRRWPFSEN